MSPDLGVNYPWAGYIVPYAISDTKFKVVNQGLFSYNGVTGEETALGIGHNSVFSCPEAILRFGHPPLITISYARNFYLYPSSTPPGEFWFAAPVLSRCSSPATTIFLADSRVTETSYGHAASTYTTPEKMLEMEPTHMNFSINISWVDGHITSEDKDTFALSPHLPDETEDVWRLMR
jgi:prepilin-type processing-associated H-X9-DG protein